jgi:WD40 repeat protein
VIDCIAFSPNGRILAAASSRRLRLWRMPGGQPLRDLPCQVGSRAYISFSNDSRHVLVGGAAGAVNVIATRLDDARDQTLLRQTGVVRAALSPDGQRAAFVTTSGVLCLWNLITNREIWRKPVPESSNHELAFSPDGRLLAMATNDAVEVLDATLGNTHFEAGHETLAGLMFSSDRVLFGWDSDGEIRAWDVAQRRIDRRFSTVKAARMLVAR